MRNEPDTGHPGKSRLSRGCVSIIVFPDQEKLQQVDEDEEDIVKNKSRFFDGDCPHQQAGTGHQNKDERRGG